MNIIIEGSVQKKIPNLVVDFLRKLIDGNQLIKEIHLVPLAPNGIQEIICEDKNGRMDKHRVFGFLPVTEKLSVFFRGNNAIVHLER